jgi:hypothetical protein
MRTDAIVLIAGGISRRWGGVIKHLLPVNGEPVIARTIRLCHEILPEVPVAVVTWNEDIGDLADIWIPMDLEHAYDSANTGVIRSYPAWSINGTTHILLGDVSWNQSTLQRVLKHAGKSGVEFNGRPGANARTGRPFKEIFSMSFPHDLIPEVLQWHEQAVWLRNDSDWWEVLMIGDYCKYRKVRYALFLFAAQIYRNAAFWNLIRPNGRTTNSPLFNAVGEDLTDDFDEPEWYGPYLKFAAPLLESRGFPD